MKHRFDQERDAVNVALYSPYDREIRDLAPVGRVVADVLPTILAAARANPDDDGAETALDELPEIGPALDYVHVQVRKSLGERESTHRGSPHSVVSLVIPDKYRDTLQSWASVGRTFDCAVNVLLDVGYPASLLENFRRYKYPMDHLQKQVATALYVKAGVYEAR